MPKENWRKSLAALADKFGDHQSHHLKSWRVIVGSDPATVLTYQVQYTNAEATEVLTFLGSGEPKISGHQINSAALLDTSK